MVYEEAANLFGIAWVLIGLSIFIVALAWAFSPSHKAQSYRSVMSSMFVVGRIRQIAKEKGIDLPLEFQDFKKFRKESRIQDEPIDVTVEKELQEEIAYTDLEEKKKK